MHFILYVIPPSAYFLAASNISKAIKFAADANVWQLVLVFITIDDIG
ncbi:TPA: hypothetical protein KD885_004732 [Vibrio parahaemolyticus]|nr:hypothetical protein [Vibrio parahaemolyticus]